MSDFYIKPKKLLIEVINFSCKDQDKRREILAYHYKEGYRVFIQQDAWSITMYKVIKEHRSFVELIIDTIKNWSTNTLKFCNG